MDRRDEDRNERPAEHRERPAGRKESFGRDRPRQDGPRQDAPRPGERGFPRRDDRPSDRGERTGDRPSGRPFEKRNGFAGRDAERGGVRERRPDGEQGSPRRDGFRPRPRGEDSRELAAIKDLDADILRLVVKRARLLSALRVPSGPGGRLAPNLEKALRTSWEEQAARLARDSRLARDMFALLQSIEPPSRVEDEQGFFNLAPARKPVDIRLPAPADSVAARSWLALAAASGQELKLSRVPLTDAVIDAVKSLNQLGGQLWWEEDGTVLSRGGKGPQKGLDKAVHAGDDAFNLWLLLAFSLGFQSRLKITGGNSLRFLSLAPVRHFLPLLGARLTNVVPGQDGLPVRLECSGLLPEVAALPDDLPPAFVNALLLAAPLWEKPCRLLLPAAALSGTSDAPGAVYPALAILRQAGADVKLSVDNGRAVADVTPKALSLPKEPRLPLNVPLAAALLALPALAGGECSLEGHWPAGSPEAALAERLLAGAGLDMDLSETEISSRPGQGAAEGPTADLWQALAGQAPDLLPLAAALAAKAGRGGKAALLPLEQLADHAAVLGDFFSLLGLGLDEQGALTPENNEDRPNPNWISPSAHWAVGVALGAFLRPHIHLANPGALADLYPAFWSLYNNLPKPDLSPKTTPEPADAKPARRRVIARGVFADLPPEPPAGDDS